MSDVEHRETLRHHHGVEINVAVSQAPVHVFRARRLLKEIFASLKRAASVKIVPENECIFAANDASALQLGSDSPGGVSRMQQDERLGRRRDTARYGPGKPAGTG